ncbi:YjbH domain-containing protein [Photobacterium sp. CAU 1568]|uniref:YjbH domain-containing protein n=1 Tax=Photobacterium arenosum TaxID=2774143 RepID=A0ABR9BPC0_9GAMM|nr:YjbH domain-containing protein [Photobacterium arenosum]MBD8514409.1 YjbH domain-containing protein [Photobacterium arenosum]
MSSCTKHLGLRFPGLRFLSGLSLGIITLTAHADDFSYPDFSVSQSDFGGVGLIQMPSGRVAPEGEFTFGATYNQDYLHYNVSLQLFPWLETTIRYTLVQDVLYSEDENFSGDTKYTDKGIDFKLRLLEESFWIPETSVGIRDFGGTGLFDGEYIAASKHWGALDFTLGLGWGYIGNGANLSGDKSLSSDCGRNTEYKGKGGSVDFERWFSGCMAVFGGVEYQTPWRPLRLKLEYDGNDYTSDFPVTRADSDMSQGSPINLGVLYRLGDWGDLRISYERGNTWTAGFNLNTNFNQLTTSWRDTPAAAYAPDRQKRSTTSADWQNIANQLHTNAGYENPTLYADDHTVTIEAPQNKYRDRDQGYQRAATLLSNQLPTDPDTGLPLYSEYRLIETSNKLPVKETRVNVKAFDQVASHSYVNASIDDTITHQVPAQPQGRLIATDTDKWDLSVSPTLQQSFGGSEGFYLYNLGVTAGASYHMTDHWELGGSVYLNLFDNYDKFLYDVPPDGTDLKRVRTLVRQYIDGNPIRVNNLQLTWMDQLADNWYGQAYTGYLEMMFAGAGSEVLYRPMGKNWALGADMNYVIQRDPDTQFGLFHDEVHFDPITGRDYKVQTGALTGHATFYYQPQWSLLPNTLMKISAGRYLTEDVGVTFDFSKQFDSGVIAGAFVTKTNLSAEEFGEGSYNKGFYISIPYDLMTVKPSRNRANISWLPLTRDGGQMLNRKYQLYNITDARYPWYSRKMMQAK